jgi:hypothetical protein
MSVGRRSPRKPPELWSILESEPKRAGALLERYLLKLGVGAYKGLPSPHSSTHEVGGGDEFIHADEHLPDGGDPLPTAAPSDDQFQDNPSEGDSSSYARADHVHSKPTAKQVRSSVRLRTLESDILWVSTKDPWTKVYSYATFK